MTADQAEGAGARARRERGAFWNSAEASQYLEELSEIDGPLTIIVGAGSSAEAGLPLWSELISELLAETARRSITGATDDDIDQFCRSTIGSEGLLGAAAIIRSLLGDAFEEAVVEALHRVVGPNPVPGPTARAVARLWGIHRHQCEIVTLNYDHLLEEALVEELELDPTTVHPLADASSVPDDHVAVRHIHGARGPDGARFPDAGDQLVLAEQDYHSLREDGWPADYLIERLQNSTCLFVGVSMLDPNILRLLYRARQDAPGDAPKHVAILARQADSWDAPVALAVEETRERVAQGRWDAIGVRTLRVDHFMQSSQFLYEIALRTALGRSGYDSYPDRMRAWERLMRSGVLRTDERATFAAIQDDLQEELHELAATVARFLADDLGGLAEGERIGLHLWVRRFSERGLMLWGSADRSWRDPEGLSVVPTTRPSKWISVLAFFTGTPIAADIDGSSRWRSVRAVPIFLDGDVRWGRLPVAVVTLASNVGDGGSSLHRASPAAIDLIHRWVADLAAVYLTPDPRAADAASR